MDKPQIIGHIEKSLNYTLFDAKWIPGTAKFVVLGSQPRGTGTIQVYELVQGDVKVIAETEKSKSFKSGHFGASLGSARHLATGDFDGRLNLWDINTLGANSVPIYTAQAHKEIINAVDAVGGLGIGYGAPEIATASRDGSVKIWDVRQKNDPVVTMSPQDGETKRDCWAVAFGNAYNEHDRCVASGYDNGDVKLFDLRKMALRWETNIRNGVCSLEFDRKDIMMNKLVVTSLESKIHVYDMRTQHSTKGFSSLTEKGHDSTVWMGRHLPQNRDVFMTCGGNGTLYLWKYSYPAQRKAKDAEGEEYGQVGSLELLQNIMMSTQPVASFDWSPDKAGLAVCTSFDQTMRVLIVTKLNKI